MENLIKEIFNKYEIKLTNDQIEKFVEYYKLLVEWNEKFNLTAITEFKDVVVKHFLDSVLPYKEIKDNSTLIDIGTGAGFPGIPLKIINNSLNITLVDSLNKRITFLNEVINKLQLKNITAIHSRCEDIAKTSKRESFDYVVSRAVAKLNTLSEYCAPLVKNGGTFIAYKSEGSQEELDISKNAFNLLNLKLEKILNYNIENNTRNILFIKKFNTIKSIYPRDKNKPKTNPL